MIFSTLSIGTKNAKWKSPNLPVLPMNTFTVSLPSESVIKNILIKFNDKKPNQNQLM